MLDVLAAPARALLVLAAAAFPAAAAGADYPVRPIRFVIGPTPDLLPRLLAQKLSESWGQQVVLDTRPGGGGTIAAETVARATPDGYTWLVTSSSYIVNSLLYPKTAYNLQRDFAPVTLLATVPFIAVAHPSVPVKSLADLVQLARSRPGQLNFASAGNGTAPHLAGEMLKIAAKVDMVHVPYKGVPQAVIDLVGGQVQFMFPPIQSALPHVATGRLRALGVTSGQRARVAPELPTIAESGFPGFELVGWNAVHVPLKTPRAVIEQVNAEMLKALKLKEVQDRILPTGLEITYTTVAEFTAFVGSETAKYTKVIRDSNIRGD